MVFSVTCVIVLSNLFGGLRQLTFGRMLGYTNDQQTLSSLMPPHDTWCSSALTPYILAAVSYVQ